MGALESDAPFGEIVTRKEAAKTFLERREQRRSLSAFFVRAWHVFNPGIELKHNWHIDLMCEYLEAAWAGEIQKLIINIPPRNLKSNVVTVTFPAWGLGRNPAERFVCQSYSSKLSIKHSVDCRLIVESGWYQNVFPGTIIARDQNEKSKFQTTMRGHRIATSIGGTATGEGGNYLITDDPVNPKQAMSDQERNTANEWMDQAWSSRKDDPATAVEIIVMQRLHVDDPTGHVLAEDKTWEHLVIPQEAEKKTIITFPRSQRVVVRETGDLLHPERVGPEAIAGIKARLGSYGYSAQQQQRPSPAGGGIVKVKWFQRYQTPPHRNIATSIRISIDTGTKDKQINDPSVAGIFFETQSGHYLIDVWTDRVIYPDLKRTVRNLLELWRPNECLIEDKGSGQQLIQDLLRETNYAIIAMEPKGLDKVTRMSNESPVIEAGQVYLPESAPWLFDFEQEIALFPNAVHDDQVDMLSQYLKRVREPGEIYIG